MLKTSPILTSSANASPTTLRNAPSAHSNPKTPILRRQDSSRSATSTNGIASKPPAATAATLSPSLARLKGPDVAMPANDSQSDHHDKPSRPQLPPSPSSQNLTVTTKAENERTGSALSPNKRRSPPSHSADSQKVPTSDPPVSEPSTQTAKRIKPDEQPPKTLPLGYEFCHVEDMVELISYMLSELITTNDAIRISGTGGLTRFHSRTAPAISVRDYLHRLARHATLTPPLLLAMVYYIDRLCAMYQEFTINTLTVHRFLITAATVAAKGLSDSFWNNTTYARVGGVKVAELKMLELEFLHRVDWKIVPNPEVLVAYYTGLVERTPGYVLQSSSEASDDGDSEELDD